MVCERGFNECYDAEDVLYAIIDTMCERCLRREDCYLHTDEEYNGHEDWCIHVNQIVTCIYTKFKGD